MKKISFKNIALISLFIGTMFSFSSCIDTSDLNLKDKDKTIENLVVSDDFNWETSKSVVLILNAISEHPELSSKVSVYNANPNLNGALLLNCGVTESKYFEGELQVLVAQEKLFFECEFPGGYTVLDSLILDSNNTIEHTFHEMALTTQIANANVEDGPDCSVGCDEEITRTNGDIVVEGNKTYCLTSDFSGNITFQGAGGILRICGNTTLYNVNRNGSAALNIQVTASGTLNVSNLNLNGDASLQNWGTLNYSGNFSTSANFTNYGIANISGLNVNTGGSVVNENQLNISGSFNNSSQVTNNGAFIVSGHFNNNGGSTLVNNCRLIVTGNFYQNSVFNNYGYLSVGGGFTINSGSRTSMFDQAMISTRNFMLNANITGTGEYSSISVAANTTINGSGSITGTIDLCDANGIETNTGSISSSVTFCDNYIPVSECNPVGIGVKPLDDADNDGVIDSQDEFPNDATKAYRSFFPSENTQSTLLFEDLWPAQGDYDFNDLVAGIEGEYITNSDNKVVQLNLSIEVKAVGASNRNGLGLQFDDLTPANITSINGYVLKSTESAIRLNANGTEADQEKAVSILIENFEDVIHRAGGATFNTLDDGKVGTSDLVEVSISFADQPVSFENVSVLKLNFFLIKNQNRGTEIHMADRQPTNLMTHEFASNADTSYPENGRYYKTKNNLPWGILIFDEISYPLEKVAVTEAYSNFYDWAASNGTSNTNWYTSPNILSIWQKSE